ncbi:MAG: dTMP kinase [Candidatus Omnitrophica bacterium]|nr:dTMP kinase [Candidatus Omnitrophota bacterium]
MRHKGVFITFEGSEGCGKSTQSRKLLEYLTAKGVASKLIREPGGVAISEKVRALLLDKSHTAMNKECETLLYMAARAQLVEEVVIPELEKGTVLICDRFLDSTVAYQGYGCGVDIATIKSIGLFATKGIQPDMTFFLDLDTEEGLRRRGGERDRIELRSVAYHHQVRVGYLDIAKKEPGRVLVIDGRKPIEENFNTIREAVERKLRA